MIAIVRSLSCESPIIAIIIIIIIVTMLCGLYWKPFLQIASPQLDLCNISLAPFLHQVLTTTVSLQSGLSSD